jgi:hypothetical protein
MYIFSIETLLINIKLRGRYEEEIIKLPKG